MNQTVRRRLIRASAILLIAIAICSALYAGAVAVLNTAFVDAKETNTRAVEHLLKLAQENPTGSFPQRGADSYVQTASGELSLADDPRCWAFLQEAITQNLNRYSLAAYDNGPAQFRDVDDSIVQVDFADGRRVKMVFYQGNLVACDTASKAN